MQEIRPYEVPLNSYLRSYKGAEGHADCYMGYVPGAITQAQFVEAFYTTSLFKVERTLLSYLAARPATDADAQQLAAGLATSFSAWRVEAQSASELLLADFTGRTRSWLMATPVTGSATTRLYFGSAVVARASRNGHRPDMGWPFHALLGFHRLYSRLLLGAACRRLGAA